MRLSSFTDCEDYYTRLYKSKIDRASSNWVIEIIEYISISNHSSSR